MSNGKPMSDEVMTEDEVRDEVERLMGVLEWYRTQDAVDLHTIDHCSTDPYAIVAGFMELLAHDCADRGLNPAYVLGYCMLRIMGQRREWRDDFEKVLNVDGLDELWPYREGD